MKKNIICIVLGILFSTFLYSQTAEPSSGVDKNILQLEFESLYTVQKEGSDKIVSWSIPSTLLRFGLLNTFELQLNIPIVKEKLYEHDHHIHSLQKFDDAQFGFSINLWKEKNILPEAALMIRALIPLQDHTKLADIGNVVSLNLSNTLSNTFTLSYNLGYVKETDDSTGGFYIVNLGYEPNDQFHFFIENFGDFHANEIISHSLNTGVGYNFNDNLTLDLSIAKGLDHNMFYVGGIVTWVINTKKN